MWLFLYLNNYWQELLGGQSKMLKSKRFTGIIHPDDINSTTEAASAILTEAKGPLVYLRNRM